MTVESWQGATEAKVQGTWNLHNALHDQQEPVDFFVLLSSIYGIQGNPKQANYAAASTFLDAFVQFRQQQGLPASVIDLGVMEDIGFVSQHTSILENLRRAGAQCKCFDFKVDLLFPRRIYLLPEERLLTSFAYSDPRD